MRTIGLALLRSYRLAVPILSIVLTGTLQAHPGTIWLLPVLAAAGKGLRETYPDNAAVNLLPF